MSNSRVVTPSRLGNVNCSRQVLCYELKTKADCSSTGKSLSTGNSLAFNHLTVSAKDKPSGTFNEVSIAVDFQIFLKSKDSYVIEDLVVEVGLDFLDDFEDIGFTVFITIGTDSQVHFIRVFVCLKGDFGAEDGVRGSHGDALDLCV